MAISSSGYRVPAFRMEPASSSGQKLVGSTDCAIHLEHIVTATTAVNVPNHGYAILNSTKVIDIDPPEKGCKVQIQFNSSKTQTVKCSTTRAATINNSTDDVIAGNALNAAAGAIGACVTLVGGSTVLWYLMGISCVNGTGVSTGTGWLFQMSSST